MKKAKSANGKDEMRAEYEIPWDKAVCGKYAKRFSRETLMVAIDPELRILFPTADAVNTALRALAEVARRGSQWKPHRKSA